MGKKQTTTSGIDWNTFLGLSERLKRDGHLRDYLLITMGCYFGLRISDLLSIEWNDVLEKTELSIQESKTGKTRLITLNPKVAEAIEYCSEKIDCKRRYVFANRWDGKLIKNHISL